MCLVKSFARVAREMLYSYIMIGHLHKIDVSKLLWSILENPGCAKLVKSIHLVGDPDVAPNDLRISRIA